MFRVIIAAISLLPCCSLPCAAQGKKKDSDFISVGAGDRLELKKPIPVAKDFFEGIELTKSLEAKDKEGVAAMIAEKRAQMLDPGMTLVILEISTKTAFREARSHECRVIKDGKAIGKFPVYRSWFTTEYMKMTEDN